MKLGFHIGYINPGARMQLPFIFPDDYDFDEAFRYIETDNDPWIGECSYDDFECVSSYFNNGKRIYKKQFSPTSGDEEAIVYWVSEISEKEFIEIVNSGIYGIMLTPTSLEECDFLAEFWF